MTEREYNLINRIATINYSVLENYIITLNSSKNILSTECHFQNYNYNKIDKQDYESHLNICYYNSIKWYVKHKEEVNVIFAHYFKGVIKKETERYVRQQKKRDKGERDLMENYCDYKRCYEWNNYQEDIDNSYDKLKDNFTPQEQKFIELQIRTKIIEDSLANDDDVETIDKLTHKQIGKTLVSYK